MRRDVFQAIADPTRREILNMLSRRSMNLNSIAGSFDISRPAVSKHLKILTECGVVTIRRAGRERVCEARLDKLGEVHAWVDQYRTFWTQKFDDLEKYLERLQTKKSKSKKKKKK
jgi:DNA-binding transcriptional ArsR family regulator